MYVTHTAHLWRNKIVPKMNVYFVQTLYFLLRHILVTVTQGSTVYTSKRSNTGIRIQVTSRPLSPLLIPTNPCQRSATEYLSYACTCTCLTSPSPHCCHSFRRIRNLGYALHAGSCEHGNEHSASIKGLGFVEWLRDYWDSKVGVCFMELNVH
jgi:hypothetical protein